MAIFNSYVKLPEGKFSRVFFLEGGCPLPVVIGGPVAYLESGVAQT